MLDRTIVLGTIAACMLVMPAAAQTPAPTTTAFDGKYVGSATLSTGIASCTAIRWVDMTITSGQVVIHEIFFNGGFQQTYYGSVNAAGEVSTQFEWKHHISGPTIDNLNGTIHDQVCTGLSTHGRYCYWHIQMAPVPAPTMPFDGDYIGVSGGPSKTTSATGAECGQSGVPDTLTIWYGIIRSDYDHWRGTVSPQGVLVMQHRGATRVDGQIDGQGTIRAQGTNSAGCAYTWSWRKQSG